MRRTVLSFAPSFLALCLLAGGCASKAVILAPGAVPMAEGTKQAGDAAAWSLWVSSARDARTEAGQRVGTLYTRFEKTPQPAYLEPAPAQYIQQQLSRYLLHRGLEASDAGRARYLLAIDVEEFKLQENPGSAWDELDVTVAYTVRVAHFDGREFGSVRLQGGSQRKSPMDTKRQAEEALREALSDTFDALTRSEVFQRMLQGRM